MKSPQSGVNLSRSLGKGGVGWILPKSQCSYSALHPPVDITYFISPEYPQDSQLQARIWIPTPHKHAQTARAGGCTRQPFSFKSPKRGKKSSNVSAMPPVLGVANSASPPPPLQRTSLKARRGEVFFPSPESPSTETELVGFHARQGGKILNARSIECGRELTERFICGGGPSFLALSRCAPSP